jgi:hypothetical protein
VHAALATTAARWALVAAAVSAPVALVLAAYRDGASPTRATDSGAPQVRRAGGTPDRG